MRKRALSLVLALLFLLLAACTPEAKQPPASSDPPTTSDTPATNNAPTTNDAPATSDIPATKDLFAGITLPLYEGDETFEIFRAISDSVTRWEYKDFSEVPGFKRAEELTGMKIKWTVVSEFVTQFPLMIASGNWPDAGFYWMEANFTTGLDTYVDDEILLDLTDIIKENCPNYYAVRTKDDSIARDTMTDDGRLIAFYNIMQSIQGSYMALVGNGKWLNEWGGGDLRTYDDYYSFLCFARDNYHPESGAYAFNSTGLDPFMLAGFDLSVDWIVVDGEVRFSPLEPAFKDYIELMRKWWSEDLINKDVFSGTRIPFDAVANGAQAVSMCSMAWIDWMKSMSEDPEYVALPVHYPMLVEGNTRNLSPHFCIPRLNEGLSGWIFSTCKDPVLMAKWFDFWYTDGGALLANYGIEGESYEFDENGKPYFIGYVVDNEEGYAASTAWLRYIADNVPHHYDWEREINDTMSDVALSAQSIWDADWNEQYTWPRFVSRTVQESEKFAAIMSDVDTTIGEYVPRFINGELSMDEWDGFIAKVKSIGIDDATAINQAAANRYFARTER